jgi:hypothetical protein
MIPERQNPQAMTSMVVMVIGKIMKGIKSYA